MDDEKDLHKLRSSPWISSSGVVASPLSPHGGGGAGGFRGARPLGTDHSSSDPLPDPYSPSGRRVISSDVKRILLAQNLSLRDGGTSTTKGRDGGPSTKPPLRFDLVSLTPPKKENDGKYEYQQILNRHFFRFLDLTAEATVEVPDSATRRGKVVVGFIQNLLSREMKYHYTGRKTESWEVQQSDSVGCSGCVEAPLAGQ